MSAERSRHQSGDPPPADSPAGDVKQHRPSQRAFVTGGTGYLGGRLVASLLAEGWAVTVLVRRSSDRARVSALQQRGVRIAEHDGSTAQLVELLSTSAPSVVWHAATRFVGEHAIGDVAPLVQDNVVFGTQLLEAMYRTGARSLVVAGSAWQQHDNVDYAPVSLYAASKQAFEAMAAWYSDVAGMRIVVTRFTDVYGPDDERRKLLWALRTAERMQSTLEMNDGSPYIDLLHVDDAIAALRVAANRARADGGAMERWAVRPGRALRLRELVALWEAVRGTTLKVMWGARPLRARETMIPWTSGELLPEWAPRISLEDGVRAL